MKINVKVYATADGKTYTSDFKEVRTAEEYAQGLLINYTGWSIVIKAWGCAYIMTFDGNKIQTTTIQ